MENFKGGLQIHSNCCKFPQDYKSSGADYQSTNQIKKINLISGNHDANFDFSILFPEKQITRLIGVYMNTLIVAIGEDLIIGVNATNGDVLYQINAINKGFNLNTDTGFLESFMVNYVSLNALDGTMANRFINQKYFNEIGIKSSRSNFCRMDNYLITTDATSGVIGAFNTVTHEFDWTFKLDGVTFPVGSPMIYNKPYLFIQDNKDTLHIFKKEPSHAQMT